MYFHDAAGSTKALSVGDSIPFTSVKINGVTVLSSEFGVAIDTLGSIGFITSTAPMVGAELVTATAYQLEVSYEDNVKASISRAG